MAELKEKHVSLGIATPPPQASVPWCGLGEALFSAVLLPAPHLFSSPLCAQEANPHGLVTQTPGPLAWANAEGPDERLGGLLPASLLAELESVPSQLNAGFCQIIRELLPCSGRPVPGHQVPSGSHSQYQAPPSSHQLVFVRWIKELPH